MSPEAASLAPKTAWWLTDKIDLVVACSLWTFFSMWGGAELALYFQPIPEPVKVVERVPAPPPKYFIPCDDKGKVWLCTRPNVKLKRDL